MSIQITQTYQGQLEELRKATNNTVNKLAQTISKVVNTADQLGNASEKISSTSQSLSQAASYAQINSPARRTGERAKPALQFNRNDGNLDLDMSKFERF